MRLKALLAITFCFFTFYASYTLVAGERGDAGDLLIDQIVNNAKRLKTRYHKLGDSIVKVAQGLKEIRFSRKAQIHKVFDAIKAKDPNAKKIQQRVAGYATHQKGALKDIEKISSLVDFIPDLMVAGGRFDLVTDKGKKKMLVTDREQDLKEIQLESRRILDIAKERLRKAGFKEGTTPNDMLKAIESWQAANKDIMVATLQDAERDAKLFSSTDSKATKIATFDSIQKKGEKIRTAYLACPTDAKMSEAVKKAAQETKAAEQRLKKLKEEAKMAKTAASNKADMVSEAQKSLKQAKKTRMDEQTKLGIYETAAKNAKRELEQKQGVLKAEEKKVSDAKMVQEEAKSAFSARQKDFRTAGNLYDTAKKAHQTARDNVKAAETAVDGLKKKQEMAEDQLKREKKKLKEAQDSLKEAEKNEKMAKEALPGLKKSAEDLAKAAKGKETQYKSAAEALKKAQLKGLWPKRPKATTEEQKKQRDLDFKLAYAAGEDDLPKVKEALKNGADLNDPSALTSAVRAYIYRGKRKVLDYLLSKGADPNARPSQATNYSGRSALMVAADVKEHATIIGGAKIDAEVARNNREKDEKAKLLSGTFGSSGAFGRAHETVKLLLKHGGDPLILRDSVTKRVSAKDLAGASIDNGFKQYVTTAHAKEIQKIRTLLSNAKSSVSQASQLRAEKNGEWEQAKTTLSKANDKLRLGNMALSKASLAIDAEKAKIIEAQKQVQMAEVKVRDAMKAVTMAEAKVVELNKVVTMKAPKVTDSLKAKTKQQEALQKAMTQLQKANMSVTRETKALAKVRPGLTQAIEKATKQRTDADRSVSDQQKAVQKAVEAVSSAERTLASLGEMHTDLGKKSTEANKQVMMAELRLTMAQAAERSKKTLIQACQSDINAGIALLKRHAPTDRPPDAALKNIEQRFNKAHENWEKAVRVGSGRPAAPRPMPPAPRPMAPMGGRGGSR